MLIIPKDIPNPPQYTGEKVLGMLKSLKKKSIRKHMNYHRLNTVDDLNNYYNTYKGLTSSQFKLLYKLWFNFVLMDYTDIDI